MFRQKKWKCGQFLDIEIIQRPDTEKKFERAKRMRPTCPAKRNLNDRNAKKYLVRLVHTNFTEKDLFVDLTFNAEHLPETREEAQHEIRKYIARLNYANRKQGIPNVRYIYVISDMDGETGKKVRLHVHMIMSGIDRETAEAKWRNGFCNTQRLQFDEFGVTGKVLYMARQSGGGAKRWYASVGLKKPEVVISDKAVTRHAAERMERCPEDRAYFEKRYPGWTFTDCRTERHEDERGRGTGLSILIHMRKTENRRC